MTRNALILLLILLGGCLQSSSEMDELRRNLGEPPKECIGHVCLEDPLAHDAQYAWNEFGFRKLTRDGGPIHRLQVHDGLLVWQAAKSVDVGAEKEPNSDILAYDFSAKELLTIARSPDHLYAQPHLYNNRVVYTVEPQREADDYGEVESWVEIWDHSSRESRRLDVPLGASKLQTPGFDGEWAVISARGSQNRSEIGFWAYNVDDGRLVNVYRPLENETKPDGSYEMFQGITVADGIAYLALSHGPNHPPNLTDRTFSIQALDLENGTWRQVYHGADHLQDMGVTGDLLLAEVPRPGIATGIDVGFINISNFSREMFIPSRPETDASINRPPHVHSTDWIVLREIASFRRPNPQQLWAYSIEHGESRMLMNSQSLTANNVAIDDEYFAIGGVRNVGGWESVELEKDTYNIFWMTVDELEKKWLASEEVWRPT